MFVLTKGEPLIWNYKTYFLLRKLSPGHAWSLGFRIQIYYFVYKRHSTKSPFHNAKLGNEAVISSYTSAVSPAFGRHDSKYPTKLYIKCSMKYPMNFSTRSYITYSCQDFDAMLSASSFMIEVWHYATVFLSTKISWTWFCIVDRKFCNCSWCQSKQQLENGRNTYFDKIDFRYQNTLIWRLKVK